MMRILLTLTCLTIIFYCDAQVIGDFTLPDTRNNGSVSLSEFTGSKAVVIIFTSQNCPYDDYYTSRMKQLVTDYSDKRVTILFINSIPSESMENIPAKEWGAPYLSDRQQVVMKLLNVSKTPESIILIPVNGGFRKIYQGAIDNNPQVETDVKKPYLRQNLDDILAGEPLTYADVLPVGCRIRTP